MDVARRKRSGGRRFPGTGRAVLAAWIGLAAITVPACGDDGGASDPATQPGSTPEPSVEVWCSNMVDEKRRLRDQYAAVFATAPDGSNTPSSALLSLDGSAAAATSLRAYVASLAAGAPDEIAGVPESVGDDLDGLIDELESTPGQPGRAALGGLGMMGGFAALDSFAVEHCGETI